MSSPRPSSAASSGAPSAPPSGGASSSAASSAAPTSTPSSYATSPAPSLVNIATGTPSTSALPTGHVAALTSHGADLLAGLDTPIEGVPTSPGEDSVIDDLHDLHSDGESNLDDIPGGDRGDAGCPCLPPGYFEDNHPVEGTPIRKLDAHQSQEQASFAQVVGASVDQTRYGFGCAPHDLDSLRCSDAQDCTTQVPLPPDCDRSYCKRSWCWVDPSDCSRMHNPSALFEDRHYSYATCGELDSFTHTTRLRSLRGKTFQVGYAANSGGWKGAYNPHGSYATSGQWTGPVVEFVREAALEGGFGVNMTSPPEWLRPKSEEFFGDSKFDLCVYAVSLGYLDFCVGGFSINMARSSITTMFEMTSDPIYLVTFTEGGGQGSWEIFLDTTLTVAQPFTASVWLMIFVFALPVLGLLMFYHEKGEPGSAFPSEEPVIVEEKDEQGRTSTEVVHRPIPAWKNVSNAVYMGTLSFFHGSYDQSVVSVGGKIHLLGIASFVMLILAVYTANLAAILTQEANRATVDSVEMAVKQGMNICVERKIADVLIDTYGVHPSRIVPDPIELGGDGNPGFNCPNCKSRERIFDQMRRTHNDPTRYCHVAVAGLQDLEILYRYGTHCDKTKVGESIAYRASGIPIYDERSDALVSLLHKKKADGEMTRNLAAAMPESQCPTTGGMGSSLTIQQLTGVWVITFALALVALLARLITRPRCCGVHKRVPNDSGKARQLRRYDQWGNAPPHEVVLGGYKYEHEMNEASVCGTAEEVAPLRRMESGCIAVDLASPSSLSSQ